MKTRTAISAALLLALGAGVTVGLWACSSASPSMRSAENPTATTEPARVESPSPGVVAAPAKLVLSEEPWQFDASPGRVVRTPSYVLFTTLPKGQLADRMPAFLERALFHYTSEIADLPRPTEPMETFLFATRPQWNRKTQSVLGGDAGPFLRIDRGGFSFRGQGVYYDLGTINDTLTIAGHEGWHQYVQTTFREPLPTWLDEGVATYMEGYRPSPDDPALPIFMPWANMERYETLRFSLYRRRLLPLDELLRTSPQQLMSRDDWAPLRYYAQVWALIHFLREGEAGKYEPALSAMLTDAAFGRASRVVEERLGRQAGSTYRTRRDGTLLFTAYVSPDLALVDTQFKAFMDQLAQRGVRTKISQGKSPILTP
jgi:hypothetical protein